MSEGAFGLCNASPGSASVPKADVPAVPEQQRWKFRQCKRDREAVFRVVRQNIHRRTVTRHIVFASTSSTTLSVAQWQLVKMAIAKVALQSWRRPAIKKTIRKSANHLIFPSLGRR